MRLIDKAVSAYIKGGLSIIPISTKTKRPAGWLLPQDRGDDGEPLFYRNLPDGSYEETTDDTGRPKGTWKPFQQRQPTGEEIARWQNAKVDAYAIVCGHASGGVEILDFDVEGYYERFAGLVAQEIEGLPLQRTGGGGMQLAYRCPEPAPNQKLAWHPDAEANSGRTVAIETRGVNGYAVLPPSLHPSGNRYELISGRFSQIPMIGQDIRDFLITVAQSLCQAPKTRQELEREAAGTTHTPRQEPYEGDSVIDAYNARHGIVETIERHGYTRVGNGRYSRPGKASSAGVVVWPDTNKTYNMSSNDAMDSDSAGLSQPRSPFDYLLEFEHNGDWTAAVRAAAVELGMDRTTPKSVSAVTMPVTAGEDAGIYNSDALTGNLAIICQTPADADLLTNSGFPAVCITGGTWRREWNQQFARVPKLYLLFGNDANGREATAKARRMIRRATPLALPVWYSSVNDFFISDRDPAGWLAEVLA